MGSLCKLTELRKILNLFYLSSGAVKNLISLFYYIEAFFIAYAFFSDITSEILNFRSIPGSLSTFRNSFLTSYYFLISSAPYFKCLDMNLSYPYLSFSDISSNIFQNELILLKVGSLLSIFMSFRASIIDMNYDDIFSIQFYIWFVLVELKFSKIYLILRSHLNLLFI